MQISNDKNKSIDPGKEALLYHKFPANEKDYIDFQDEENKTLFDFLISSTTKYQINQIAKL